MQRIIYIILIITAFTYNGTSQVPTPAEAQSSPILLKGATAHLGNGQIITNSIIGFDKGKLTVVQAMEGNTIDESGYEVMDVSGKHIYPGFILPNSPIGLEEVSAIRAMSDSREHGSVNPNIRSIVAYNTDSEYIPTMRFNGVLLAETTPRGGRVPGTSSVVEMEGWNWEDAVHSIDIGIHVNWPARQNRRFDFSTFTVKTEPNKNYDKQVADLKDIFNETKAYMSSSSKSDNLKLDAMKGLFDSSKILFLHVNAAKEIVEAIRFAQAQGVKKITLYTGTAALYVADFLKENNISVVLPPTQVVPERADMDVDLPYRLPHLLTEKGARVSISNSGESLANGRNLGFYAGTAVAYGMDKEAALKTITSNTAIALGIEDRVGTLEVGKDATLFVSQGDAFDYAGNILQYAFISGKMVVLPNKQQALFERYSKKYGH